VATGCLAKTGLDFDLLCLHHAERKENDGCELCCSIISKHLKVTIVLTGAKYISPLPRRYAIPAEQTPAFVAINLFFCTGPGWISGMNQQPYSPATIVADKVKNQANFVDDIDRRRWFARSRVGRRTPLLEGSKLPKPETTWDEMEALVIFPLLRARSAWLFIRHS
jgi:hypothetical protein